MNFYCLLLPVGFLGRRRSWLQILSRRPVLPFPYLLLSPQRHQSRCLQPRRRGRRGGHPAILSLRQDHRRRVGHRARLSVGKALLDAPLMASRRLRVHSLHGSSWVLPIRHVLFHHHGLHLRQEGQRGLRETGCPGGAVDAKRTVS